jgi:hypothetical protein
MTIGYRATLTEVASVLFLTCGVPLVATSAGAYNVQLVVPFKAQLPPPGTVPTPAGWHLTNNCGQTSVLMVVGFYSGPLRNPPTPVYQDIQDADDWLFAQYGAPQNSYYGSETDTAQLVSLAQHYGFSNSAAYTGWTIQSIQAELNAGHPVIVAVWTNMTVGQPYAANLNKRHFMVLTGMDDTYVYVNDPGHTHGNQVPYNRYTIPEFQAAWSSAQSHQNAAVVLIHPSAPTTATVIVSATLDGNPTISPTFTLADPNGHPVSATLGTAVRGLSSGVYTVALTGGTPPNTTLTAISPCAVLINGSTCPALLPPGQTLTFTLQFTSNPPTAGFTMSSGSQSADNGQTLTVTASSSNTATVSFDATARSMGFNGNTITGWTWTANNSIFATTSTFSATFPLGTTTIGLVVKDSRGTSSVAASGTVMVVQSTGKYTFTDILDVGGSTPYSGCFANMNQQGHVLLGCGGTMTLHPVYYRVLLVTDGTTLTTVAAWMPSGGSLNYLVEKASINNLDAVAFYANRQDGVHGVFTWQNGITTLAYDDSQLPFPYYFEANAPVVNDSGTVAFTAQPGSAPFGYNVIFTMPAGGTPTLAAAPASPYQGGSLFAMNNVGQLVFQSSTAVPCPCTTGLFIGTGSAVRLIADSTTFSTLGFEYGQPVNLNDSGEVTFSGVSAGGAGSWINNGISNSLVSPSNSMAINNVGVILASATIQSLITIASGSTNPVVDSNNPVFTKTVSSIYPLAINDSGQVLFSVGYADGTGSYFRGDPR